MKAAGAIAVARPAFLGRILPPLIALAKEVRGCAVVCEECLPFLPWVLSLPSPLMVLPFLLMVLALGTHGCASARQGADRIVWASRCLVWCKRGQGVEARREGGCIARKPAAAPSGDSPSVPWPEL